MKLGTLKFVVSVFALAICLKPDVGWGTKAYGALISGVITAQPQSNEIEIAHQLYHIKANSAAAKALSSLYVGENVDAVLDGPPGGTTSEIVAITPHPAS